MTHRTSQIFRILLATAAMAVAANCFLKYLWIFEARPACNPIVSHINRRHGSLRLGVELGQAESYVLIEFDAMNALSPKANERLIRAIQSLHGLSCGDAFGERFFVHPELAKSL